MENIKNINDSKYKNINKNINSISEDEIICFRHAMQQLNVTPLHQKYNSQNKTTTHNKIPPYPVFSEQKFYAEQTNHNAKSNINFSLENLDNPENPNFDDYRKNGVQYQVIKQLRKGKFPIQAQIDLHGFDRQQALYELSFFLDQCSAVNLRCVKIIHGKGHTKGKSILKNLTQLFLQNRSEVLAYCYAKQNQGGEGAVIVLLKN